MRRSILIIFIGIVLLLIIGAYLNDVECPCSLATKPKCVDNKELASKSDRNHWYCIIPCSYATCIPKSEGRSS